MVQAVVWVVTYLVVAGAIVVWLFPRQRAIHLKLTPERKRLLIEADERDHQTIASRLTAVADTYEPSGN